MDTQVAYVRWLSGQDIAKELGIGYETVMTWIRQGKLPAQQFGRQYRMRREDFDAWAAAQPSPANGKGAA